MLAWFTETSMGSAAILAVLAHLRETKAYGQLSALINIVCKCPYKWHDLFTFQHFSQRFFICIAQFS